MTKLKTINEIKKEKPKVIILDDNELSIVSYLEEHPDIEKELLEEQEK